MNEWKPSVPPGMTPEEYRDWWERETDVPYGACWCGCGAKTTTSRQDSPEAGHVRGCPKRYLVGHHRRKSPLEYRVDAETGCWVWQRGTTAAGYGRTSDKRVKCYAHRLYYERHKGPIPEGMVVHHRCSNRACCNPDHLQAVSTADNIRAADRVKLDWRAVEDIRASDEADHAELAEKYSTTREYVRAVWRGVNWPR